MRTGGGIELDRNGYIAPRSLSGLVGDFRAVDKPRRKPAAPTRRRQPSVQTGMLTGHDRHIIGILSEGKATTETVHEAVANKLAKPSLRLGFIEERLVRLAKIGLCSQRPLPDGESSFWYLKPAARRVAPTLFPTTTPFSD